MDYTLREKSRCFSGTVSFASFTSNVCRSEMSFSVFSPPQAEKKPCPAIIFLSGLTCTEENFMVKSGVQRVAAELGVIVLAPDTSPRDTGIAQAVESYDLGEGASFYLNATTEPWRERFQMYDFVKEELPELLSRFAWDKTRLAIMGHSMGGHGALVIGLKNPNMFTSISAFSPICAPSKCSWGQKAFQAYLGDDRQKWPAYDASELIANAEGRRLPILIDQGKNDQFLADQLMPGELLKAAAASDYPLTYREQEGYDHSYYFVSSFIEDHLRFHVAQFENETS